jgi:hypothetical protein
VTAFVEHAPEVYEARRPGSPHVDGYGRCRCGHWTAFGPVEEVRRSAGEHLRRVEREDAEAALTHALEDDRLEGTPGGLDLAVALLDLLAEAGWRLSRG